MHIYTYTEMHTCKNYCHDQSLRIRVNYKSNTNSFTLFAVKSFIQAVPIQIPSRFPPHVAPQHLQKSAIIAKERTDRWRFQAAAEAATGETVGNRNRKAPHSAFELHSRWRPNIISPECDTSWEESERGNKKQKNPQPKTTLSKPYWIPLKETQLPEMVESLNTHHLRLSSCTLNICFPRTNELISACEIKNSFPEIICPADTKDNSVLGINYPYCCVSIAHTPFPVSVDSCGISYILTHEIWSKVKKPQTKQWNTCVYMPFIRLLALQHTLEENLSLHFKDWLIMTYHLTN